MTQNWASTTPLTTAPVIQIDGNNPAIIHVGDTYRDLGATITGPTDADKNLGIKTFLNGALVSNIVIDTNKVATDTIYYVATDQSGFTSTSTRTVLIEALASSQSSATATIPTSPSIVPTEPASTTAATSTAR